MATKTTYTAATIATELGTDARTARKFFRSDASGIAKVGKGGRYSLDFTPTQLAALTKKFAAWTAAGTAAKKERDEEKVAKATNVLTIKKTTKGTKSSPNTVITEITEIDFEKLAEDSLTDEIDEADLEV